MPVSRTSYTCSGHCISGREISRLALLLLKYPKLRDSQSTVTCDLTRVVFKRGCSRVAEVIYGKPCKAGSACSLATLTRSLITRIRALTPNSLLAPVKGRRQPLLEERGEDLIRCISYLIAEERYLAPR